MRYPLCSILAAQPRVPAFGPQMVKWRQPLGDGFFLTASFEDPKSEITATDGTNFSSADTEERLPDFLLIGTVEGKDWHFRLSSIFRDLKTRGTARLPRKTPWDGASIFQGCSPRLTRTSSGFP